MAERCGGLKCGGIHVTEELLRDREIWEFFLNTIQIFGGKLTLFHLKWNSNFTAQHAAT